MTLTSHQKAVFRRWLLEKAKSSDFVCIAVLAPLAHLQASSARFTTHSAILTKALVAMAHSAEKCHANQQ